MGIQKSQRRPSSERVCMLHEAYFTPAAALTCSMHYPCVPYSAKLIVICEDVNCLHSLKIDGGIHPVKLRHAAGEGWLINTFSVLTKLFFILPPGLCLDPGGDSCGIISINRVSYHPFKSITPGSVGNIGAQDRPAHKLIVNP